MAWIGGFALVAAAVFFLSLAFSRGWITEELRVVVGLVAGGGALSVGADPSTAARRCSATC